MKINVTLLGQMITFLLFVWFTYKFIWPPLTKALKDRQAKIADGLAAAERGHVELAKAQEQASQMLKESKNDASGIMLQAKKEADTVIESARQQAHDEGQRIIQQARAEVIHMVEQAKETLRHQVATIAMAGAEKVLGRTIDPQAHVAMLEKLAAEI